MWQVEIVTTRGKRTRIKATNREQARSIKRAQERVPFVKSAKVNKVVSP